MGERTMSFGGIGVWDFAGTRRGAGCNLRRRREPEKGRWGWVMGDEGKEGSVGGVGMTRCDRGDGTWTGGRTWTANRMAAVVAAAPAGPSRFVSFVGSCCGRRLGHPCDYLVALLNSVDESAIPL
ncbi:hypothetical protein ABZP36_027649 [Zizania latifolia]